MAAAWSITATGSGCCDTSPTFSLTKLAYDPYGNLALLSPANDTRVNLMLLLADRRGAGWLKQPKAEGAASPALFAWDGIKQAMIGHGPTDADLTGPSRCNTNDSGIAAFTAALGANSAVPAGEKTALIAARRAFDPGCDDAPVSAPPGTTMPVPTSPPTVAGLTSPAGKAFGAYLAAAVQFYNGQFPAASAGFAALGQAPDPWLRETASYMTARTALNAATLSAIDEYGNLDLPAKRKPGPAQTAAQAFSAYLSAYPAGRYAASAQGLLRRTWWLQGDAARLSGAYTPLLASLGSNEVTVQLVQEIDRKLFEDGSGPAAKDPLLLAVADLQRMRRDNTGEASETVYGPPLSAADIATQKPLFADNPALFDYLRGAQALFVAKAPRDVLTIIPDMSHQARFGYLDFSRQMLRGLALEALDDRNVRQFWADLFAGAKDPEQAGALELALALHDQRTGQLGQIFASGSRVQDAAMRELVLAHIAGPALLRQQATASGVTLRERDIALHVLLGKELLHGFYADFGRDAALLAGRGHAMGGPIVPAEDGTGTYEEDKYTPAPVPLGIFGAASANPAAGCPAIAQVAAELARAPLAVRARLCLAEWVRSNDFDLYPLDRPREEAVKAGALGTGPSQFPGNIYSRLEVYKAIIADPAVAPDDKALALSRAVRCYAPAGNTQCGGTDVPLAQRRAWFNRLRRDYPATRWARELKYYW